MHEKRLLVQVKLLRIIHLINTVKTCTTIPDTDSIHCGITIEELQQFCEIDNVKLGAWKHEGTFTKAKFIRQKCYLEEMNNEINITCAGMPKTCYDFVTWENFKTGFTCGGKLTFKHVKGGVKLVETDFTIKEEKLKYSIAKFNK